MNRRKFLTAAAVAGVSALAVTAAQAGLKNREKVLRHCEGRCQ